MNYTLILIGQHYNLLISLCIAVRSCLSNTSVFCLFNNWYKPIIQIILNSQVWLAIIKVYKLWAVFVCFVEMLLERAEAVFQKLAFGVLTSSKCNPVKKTIHVTQKHANDVMSPSFNSSQMPPYSSSSIFWKFKQYKYTMPQLIAVNLFLTRKRMEREEKSWKCK